MKDKVIASGTDFMAFVREGNQGAYSYRPIAAQGNTTLSREANYRESNQKNNCGYKNFFPGLKGWSATVEMMVPEAKDPDEVDFEELQDWEHSGEKKTFVFAWVKCTGNGPEIDMTKRMYSGLGLVNCPLTANNGENVTTSIAIQGCLKLEIIDPA